MKKIVALLVVFLLFGCNKQTDINSNLKKEKTFLGTIKDSDNNMVLLLNTEVYLTTVDPNKKDKLIKQATEEIKKYHILLDSHHYYTNNKKIVNNITVLNDSIGKGPIQVDPIIIDALSEALKLTKLTKGYFNPTLGLLSSLYNNKYLPYDSTNIDPKEEEIESAVKGIINYDEIENYILLDKDNSTVELKENEYPYSLDISAFSKGYIIDKVYNKLKENNTSFLLNAGASTIATYSSENEKISWTIGVSNPNNPSENLLLFNLDNGAISTSGDYENYYYLEDGTRRHHILNPYTGYSENYYRSNTLISSDAGIIDALSTALFNIKEEKEFKEIIHTIENHYTQDISYLMITDSFILYSDKSFSDRIIENTIPNNIVYDFVIIDN